MPRRLKYRRMRKQWQRLVKAPDRLWHSELAEQGRKGLRQEADCRDAQEPGN